MLFRSLGIGPAHLGLNVFDDLGKWLGRGENYVFIVKISDGHKTGVGEVDNEYCNSQNLSFHEVMTLVVVDTNPIPKAKVWAQKSPNASAGAFFHSYESKR